MKTLWLCLKGEIRKLLARKKYIVITLIGALICFIRLGINLLVAHFSHGTIKVSGSLPMSMIGFAAEILAPLIVFMAITDLFCGEIQTDTIKASLMRPVTRFKVMLSKTLAAFIIGCISILMIFIVCALMQFISGSGTASLPHSFLSYIIDMIPLFAVCSLALLINMLIKSPSLSMLFCIGVYVLFKYLNFYVSPIGQMVFTAYLEWHKLWIGTILPAGALINKCGILFGSILILYAVSYIIFERRDF